MKKTKDIIGLPVFTVVEGRQVGQVKDLVINPDEGKVEYLLVSNGRWYVGASVLPYQDVMGVGEHAVTTESENQLTSITEAVNVNSLLAKNVELSGNRILTSRGDVLGLVNEYELDENTGIITRLFYQPANNENAVEEIAADRVLTYGADVVVVKHPDAVLSAPPPAAHETVSSRPVTAEVDGAALFKQRQREYLLGKKATKDIRSEEGQVIIAEGTVITNELIDLAEQYNKFVELSQVVK